MKMTCNSRMQSLILVTALSIGLFFASPVAARLLLLDSSGKVLSELGTGEVLVSYISSPQAYGINGAGQVGGTFYAEDHSIGSFITGPTAMGMTGLGTLGGRSFNINSIAFGINNSGQVVGSAYTPAGDEHAFITDPMAWA